MGENLDDEAKKNLKFCEKVVADVGGKFDSTDLFDNCTKYISSNKLSNPPIEFFQAAADVLKIVIKVNDKEYKPEFRLDEEFQENFWEKIEELGLSEHYTELNARCIRHLKSKTKSNTTETKKKEDKADSKQGEASKKAGVDKKVLRVVTDLLKASVSVKGDASESKYSTELKQDFWDVIEDLGISKPLESKKKTVGHPVPGSKKKDEPKQEQNDDGDSSKTNTNPGTSGEASGTNPNPDNSKNTSEPQNETLKKIEEKKEVNEDVLKHRATPKKQTVGHPVPGSKKKDETKQEQNDDGDSSKTNTNPGTSGEASGTNPNPDNSKNTSEPQNGTLKKIEEKKDETKQEQNDDGDSSKTNTNPGTSGEASGTNPNPDNSKNTSEPQNKTLKKIEEKKEVNKDVLKIAAKVLGIKIIIGRHACEPEAMVVHEFDEKGDEEKDKGKKENKEKDEGKKEDKKKDEGKEDKEKKKNLWEKLREENSQRFKNIEQECVDYMLTNECVKNRQTHGDVMKLLREVKDMKYDEYEKVFQAAANIRGGAITLINKEGEEKTFSPTPVPDVTLTTKDDGIFCNDFDFVDKDLEDDGDPGKPWVVKFLAKLFSTIVFAAAVGLGTITVKSTLLVLANAYTQDYSLSTCPKVVENGEVHYNHTKYSVMLMLMICLCTPDIVSFLYAVLRIIKTKEKSIFQKKVFLGLGVEILHAIGLTLLVLKVFPNVDSTVASMIFTLVAIFGRFRGINFTCGKNAQAENGQQVRQKTPIQGKSQSVVTTPEEPRSHSKKQENSSNDTQGCKIAALVVSLVCLLIGYVVATWITLQTSDISTAICIFICPILISCRYVGTLFDLNKSSEKKKQDKKEKSENEEDKKTKTDEEKEKKKKREDALQDCIYKASALYAFVRLIVIVSLCFGIYFLDGNGVVVKQGGLVETNFIHGIRLTRKCSRIIKTFMNTAIVNIVSSFLTFFFGFVACQAKVQKFALYCPIIIAYIAMVVLTLIFSTLSDGRTLMDFFNLPVRYPDVDRYIGWRSEYNDEFELYAICTTAAAAIGCLGLICATSNTWEENKHPRARLEKLFKKPVYPIIGEEMLLNRRTESDMTPPANSAKAQGQKSSSIPYIYICTTIYHESRDEMKQILTSIMRLVKESKKYKEEFGFETHVWIDDAIDKTAPNKLLMNNYVKVLLETIPEAARLVDKTFKPRNRTVSIAPYGGRYEYTLPNDQKLYIHLKDTRKVKQKKRWSQCMYLYYILKYKKREKGTRETYILALDGDVDFQPEAVKFVLNVATKHSHDDVGAVCGRIRPLGHGPVFWYQEFEYAVGHWFQKTAEDVIGCVLCSPGCFSLFRTDALELTSVAGTYSQESTEGKHKIQYDQGEDRWLCTLLLKAGKRIEYAANSDAFTNAPTEFAEFFNQRRRWAPSTMANILDILLDSKTARKNNASFTLAYVIYQWALVTASLLGPSTVVLVIQGALQYVFGMNAIGALMLALIPVVIYIIICYTTSPEFQISVARVLTLVYALVMMVVVVGVIGQMVQSILNPSSVFLLFMIGLFTFTGLLHPAELTCLIYGVMYYLCVPSAFIFLPIYSYCNMHIVSWGTRESAEDKKKTDKKKKNENGSYSCGFGNVCKCLLCVKPDTVIQIEKPRKLTFKKLAQRIKMFQAAAKAFSLKVDLRDEVLSHGKPIKVEERQFWVKIIEKYLKPSNKENKEKIKQETMKLRNLMSGAYIFINGLWLALTFSLAMIIEDANISYYDKNGNEVVLNPLAFTFLIFFLVILVIQFAAMLFHRFDTFIHLMAETEWPLSFNKIKTGCCSTPNSSNEDLSKDGSSADPHEQPSDNGSNNSSFDNSDQSSSNFDRGSADPGAHVHRDIDVHNPGSTDSAATSSGSSKKISNKKDATIALNSKTSHGKTENLGCENKNYEMTEFPVKVAS